MASSTSAAVYFDMIPTADQLLKARTHSMVLEELIKINDLLHKENNAGRTYAMYRPPYDADVRAIIETVLVKRQYTVTHYSGGFSISWSRYVDKSAVVSTPAIAAEKCAPAHTTAVTNLYDSVVDDYTLDDSPRHSSRHSGVKTTSYRYDDIYSDDDADEEMAAIIQQNKVSGANKWARSSSSA